MHPDPTPQLTARLVTERALWLATLRADGSPHVTPVWFVHRTASFWIGCDAASTKVRNVRRDPRVSLALQDPDAPVVAEGEARIVEDDLDPDVVTGFATKYDGWDPGLPSRPGERRVLLEVPVRRWLLAGTAR